MRIERWKGRGRGKKGGKGGGPGGPRRRERTVDGEEVDGRLEWGVE